MNHFSTKKSRPINYKPLFMIVVSLILALVMSFLLQFNHLQINLTPSMPLGIYRIIQNGDIVAVCLPNHIAQKGLEKKHLIKGKCPSGVISVVKEVIAIPGDTVTLSQEGITVNNQFYPAPKRSTDSQGLVIKRFVENGVYSTINDYWLYGSHSPNYSWDSRYFGGVSKESILNILKVIMHVS